MSRERDEWERWCAVTGFDARIAVFTEKHRLTRELSAGDYLERRRVELADELGGKHLIYLDTKHWVNLCHVVVQGRQCLAIYEEILHLLKSLRQKRRICCPLSSALFEELMKQSDTSTRVATARMMDFLSGGVSVQNWLALVRAEFGRHICRTFHLEESSAGAFSLWTKVGYWAGEHVVEYPYITEDKAALEKAYVDLRWEMTCEDYQSMPEWLPTPDDFSIAWVTGSNKARSAQTGAKLNFQGLLRLRRGELLSLLKDELLDMLPLCRGQPGSPGEHIQKVLDPIYTGTDLAALPSLEVIAGLDAAIASDASRKVQANDILDYCHAAQSLAYCDALFCDNYMAQKLRNRPLQFGKVYQTHIGSRPEEIVLYLKEISGE